MGVGVGIGGESEAPGATSRGGKDIDERKRRRRAEQDEGNIKRPLGTPATEDSHTVVKPDVGTAGLESEVRQRRERAAAAQRVIRAARQRTDLLGAAEALLGRPGATAGR